MINLERALAIQGWMELDELQWLAHMASAARAIVEVGTWKGRSARAMADHSPGTVYVVDNWCEASETVDLRNSERIARGPSAIEADWQANLRDLLATGKVQLVRGHSPDMAPVVQLRTGGVDFAFIDADHSPLGCLRDLRAYQAIVKSGGILAGHDYTTAVHPGVKEAVDLLFAPEVHQGPGSIWWVRV